jgi:tetratricopeptide (TPR) repeat protein
MHVVFDRSWQRLSAKEQQVLSQLSVFRGGFSRQAAEQVAGASLPVLSTLVNRTLLRRAAAGRYQLHVLVRQYSATHLAADPQAHAAAQKRHYDYFLALAEAVEQGLMGRDRVEWLARLEQEQDNLRAALEWALEYDRTVPGGDELALRLSGALRRFWAMRGHFHEGRRWLTRSLQQHPEGRTATRAVALLGQTLLTYALGDIGASRLVAEDSAAICRELGDQRGLGEALTSIGLTLAWQGEASLSQARLAEALAICREAGDGWGEARALNWLGSYLTDYDGDLTGQAMLEGSAAILGDLEEKFVLIGVVIAFGIVDREFGDYETARARLEYALAMAREIESPLGLANTLPNLGCVHRILGEYSVAQSYLEEALQVNQEHGCSMWETDVLCALAENALSQGDLVTARCRLQAACNRLGTSENKWLQLLVCYLRGLLAYYEGDAVAAMRLLEETTALAREGQFRSVLARSLVALGRAKRTQGQALPASELLVEGLDLSRALGYKLGIATALEELGAVSAVQGDGGQAAMLFGTAHTLREALGAPLPPVDRAAYESAVAVCRAQLGETAFAEAWAHAAARPFQDVLDSVHADKKHLSS